MDVELGPHTVWGEAEHGTRSARLQKQLRKALAETRRISAA